ncbi:MAG TPA: hypothetical protein DHV42_02405 [Lachnospiraceae bacterium]|nr:hypothetical protein [Lachnospiraceae bacterium]
MKHRYLMDLHLFDDPVNPVTGTGASNGNGGQNAGANGGASSGGTFTYEQLDEIATSRADRASKAALKSYFQQHGLSEQEAAAAIEQYKKDKASRTPDVGTVEKERDQYKAQLEERDQLDLLRDKNVRPEDLDYVRFKIQQMVDDKTDFKKAAEKFLKENPRFAGGGYRVSTSAASASTGSSAGKNSSINDAIRNAARR